MATTKSLLVFVAAVVVGLLFFSYQGYNFNQQIVVPTIFEPSYCGNNVCGSEESIINCPLDCIKLDLFLNRLKAMEWYFWVLVIITFLVGIYKLTKGDDKMNNDETKEKETEEEVVTCSRCGQKFEVDTELSSCDECGEEDLCEDCMMPFENVSVCRKCCQAEIKEKIVEKIVEIPVYINDGAITQETETAEEYEKRIINK